MVNGETSTSELLDLLGEIVELPPQQQAARIAELALCDADRTKLRDWLGVCEGSDSFLEKTPSLVLRSLGPMRGSAESADSASLRSVAPPSVSGYEVKELLGQGGMATVWRAVQAGTGREVALKVMEPLLLASPRARARFERELRLAARLRHPHIARVYDGGSTGSVCYNVMELIDGVPLDQFVEIHRLSQRQIIDLMTRVCRAVAHAHQNAVIHRDLKPSNILVDDAGEPHLLDFGLARALEEATADGDLLLTLDGELAGTPAYMSPEQASGAGALDTRTDVYSLGVILYRLLVGRPPHDLSGSRMEVLRRIAQEPASSSRTGPRQVDRLMEAVLLRALAGAREDRYPSVADFAKDLGAYLNGEAVAASPPSGPERLRRFVRKNRVGLAIASAFIAVLVGATVVSTWQAVRATKFGAAALVDRDRAVQAQKAEAAQHKAADQARAETEWINKLLTGMTASVDLKDLNKIRQTRRSDTRPLESADVLSELADQLRGRGRVVEAEALSREALRQDEQAGDTSGINVLYHWAHHVQILEDKGDRDGAEQWMTKTLAEARREFPEPNRLLGYGIYSTALLLSEHGKYAQAESLAREVWQMRERHPEIDAAGGGDEAVAICLEQIYRGQGNLAEARRWSRYIWKLREATLSELTGAIDSHKYDAGKPAIRGMMYGRLGRFLEAAEDFKTTVGLDGEERHAWYHLMAALLGAGKQDEYAGVRRRTLALSIPASDPIMCAEFDRAYLIRPPDGTELASVLRLADVAVRARPDDAWCCLAEGMAQYRLGRYGPALVWLCRSLNADGEDARRDALAELYIAMSFERLGRHTAAQSALLGARDIMETTLQRPGAGDLGFTGTFYSDDFQDTVFARAALDEASGMISEDGPPQNPDASRRKASIWRAPAEARWAARVEHKLDVLSEWLSIGPGDATALTARGEAFAERGSFPQAAADFGKALGLNPDDSRALRFGLPVFFLCGDQLTYSRARAAALSHAANDGAAIVVGCLLGAGGKALDQAGAVADRLAAADRANPWNCLAKGLAEYRRGHNAEAASWLAAADSDENVRDVDRLACSRFFLALAQSRQGNSGNALANFETGSDLLQRKTAKPQERNQSGGMLLDWLVCQCAAPQCRATMRP